MRAIGRALRITFGCQYRIVKILECLLVILGIVLIFLLSLDVPYVYIVFATLSVFFIVLYAILVRKSSADKFTQNKIENKPLLISHYALPIIGEIYCAYYFYYVKVYKHMEIDLTFGIGSIIFVPFATWFVIRAIKTKPIPDARILHCTYLMAASFIFYTDLCTFFLILEPMKNPENWILTILKVITAAYITFIMLTFAEVVAIFLSVSKDLHKRLIFLITLRNVPTKENANQRTDVDSHLVPPTIRHRMLSLLQNNRVSFGMALFMLSMTPLVVVCHLNSFFLWNDILNYTYFVVIYLTYSICVLMSALYLMKMETWVPTKMTKYITDVILVFGGAVGELIICSMTIMSTMKNMQIRFSYFLIAKVSFSILQVTFQFMTSREMLCKKVYIKGNQEDSIVERIKAEEKRRLDAMVAPSLILCVSNFIVFFDNMVAYIIPNYPLNILIFVNVYRLHGFVFFLNIICMKLGLYWNR